MWTLDDVVVLLEQHGQRATYGAVTGVVGGTPNGLMSRRPRCPRNSWVVAANNNRRTGARRGYPTGYMAAECHPNLMRRSHVINNRGELLRWLGNPQ